MSHLPENPATSNIFFRSGRVLTLRLVTLVCLIPLPLTVWLITLPLNGWRDTPLTPSFWWLIPVALVALAAVLPLSLLLLHDRYVLQLERSATGSWRLTTLLLWGERVREFSSDELAESTLQEEAGEFDSHYTVSVSAPFLRVRLKSQQKLIFDRQCEAPHGWDALEAIFGRQSARPTSKKVARHSLKK